MLLLVSLAGCTLPPTNAALLDSVPSPDLPITPHDVSIPAQQVLTFVVDLPDGWSELRAVTFGCFEDDAPCLSPPTTLLARQYSYSPPNAIEAHAWSPNGQHVVITMPGSDDTTDIYLADVSHNRISGVRDISGEDLVWEIGHSWTGDSASILATKASFSWGPTTWLLDTAGNPIQQLLASAEQVHAQGVVASHSTDLVAFTAPDQLDTKLYVSTLDGTSVAQLTDSGVVDVASSFYPDGKSIVYCWRSAHDEDVGQLIILQMASPASRQVVMSSSLGCASPAWSPDGKWIAFTTIQQTISGIAIVSLDGTRLLRVDTGGGWAKGPQWKPNDPDDDPAP